jgi:hypothetical protein
MEQTKFIEIFAKLRQIIEPLEVEYEDKISLKDLLDFVLRIYVHEEIALERKGSKPIQETKPATEKQIAFLKELNCDNIPKDLTSAEASILIKEWKIKSYAKKPNEFI